jgi:hypothetical protein
VVAVAATAAAAAAATAAVASSGTAALVLIWLQSAALARLSQKRIIIASCTRIPIYLLPYTSPLHLY